MDKVFSIDDESIYVRFNRHTVHLLAGYPIRRLIKRDWHNIEALACEILATYKNLYSKDLGITCQSLTIEILAHAYTYRICLFMRTIFPRGLFRLISLRSGNIDCGAAGHDNNRWIWDFLSYFKSLIFLFANRKS
ncbi:MAG: hypothetical protein QM640_13445 [Niabella sp.]